MANNDNDYSANRIKNMTCSKCEDELAQIRYDILIKVGRMSRDWQALMALNLRKEKIQTRLEELGIRLKDQ